MTLKNTRQARILILEVSNVVVAVVVVVVAVVVVVVVVVVCSVPWLYRREFWDLTMSFTAE